MKWIANIIKEMRVRRQVRRSFEPRAEFMRSSREAFLAEVTKRRVAPFAPQLTMYSFAMRTVRYGVAFAVVALMGTSGLVAYADYRNVPVENALYPLKRIGEQVRVAAVSSERKVEVYKEIAQRRANEFVAVGAKKKPDTDGDVKALRKLEDKEHALRAEFRRNIEKIEERSTVSTELPVAATGMGLCQAAQSVEKNNGNGKSDAYKKFEDRCKELLQTDDDSSEWKQEDGGDVKSEDDSSQWKQDDDNDDNPKGESRRGRGIELN